MSTKQFACCRSEELGGGLLGGARPSGGSKRKASIQTANRARLGQVRSDMTYYALIRLLRFQATLEKNAKQLRSNVEACEHSSTEALFLETPTLCDYLWKNWDGEERAIASWCDSNTHSHRHRTVSPISS